MLIVTEKKRYSEKEVFDVIKKLEKIINERKEINEIPPDFILEHQWSELFLSARYREASILFELSQHIEVILSVRIAEDTEKELIRDNKINHSIDFISNSTPAVFIHFIEEIPGVFSFHSH